MELITLHTKSITYQIGVNENGFLRLSCFRGSFP